MKKIIVGILKKRTGLDKQKIEEIIEIPPTFELGDYAFPCFLLAKKVKKNPRELSIELAKKIRLTKGISKVEAIGPYVNFFIDKKLLARRVVKEILEKGENYGGKEEKRKIIIDFSAPNIGKPMHVGHIRSTVLGDSLKRIFGFLGNEVIGINYLGDMGLHIGKLIVAYKLWGDEEKIKENPEKELLNLYIKFCKEEKLSIEQELKMAPRQERVKKYRGNKWTQKARAELKKLEKNNTENKKIVEKIKKYSLRGFLKTYEVLDIEFDEIVGQSEFSNLGKEIVKKALKKEVAVKRKKGEVVVNLEKYGLPDKVILRSDGTVLYSTQDLGAAVERYKKYKFDKMIYVVGSEQELYFRQIFKILEQLGYKWANKLMHLSFGLLRLKEGKISSREGRVLFLEDIIKRAKELALEQTRKKNPRLKNKQEIAEKIAVAALKYSTLSKEPIKNIEFNFLQAISFEGNTGPYLQYSHARASSILKKAREKPTTKFVVTELTKQENELIRKLREFSEIIKKASEQLNPALISNYLFELAQLFNGFYHFCPVIGSKSEKFRLALVKSFKIVVGKGSHLLGVEPLEEM